MLPSSSCSTNVRVPCSTPAAAAGEARRVAPRHDRFAAGLDADQPHAGVVDERVEDADGIAAAADAGDDRIGQPPGLRRASGARASLPDHRSGTRAPSADRDAGRAPSRAGSRCRSTLATQSRIASLMASFSVRLPASTPRTVAPSSRMRKTLSAWRRHVLGAHVDDALEAEQRAGRGRGHAVLPGAGLGDDAPLAHALGEQRLAERVVDLVRAGVRQVFALQEDAGAAAGRADSRAAS